MNERNNALLMHNTNIQCYFTYLQITKNITLNMCTKMKVSFFCSPYSFSSITLPLFQHYKGLVKDRQPDDKMIISYNKLRTKLCYVKQINLKCLNIDK